MKAVRLHDRLDLRYEIVEMAPVPGPDDVRLRVAYAGICGSDIHNYKTGAWITRKPSIAGHEFSGWVEAVGSNVNGLRAGDKVIVDSRYYCGCCINCRSNRAHLCEKLGFVGEAIDGGFAEYATLPARLLVKCSADARMDIVVLAEPLAVALHALQRLGVPDDQPLLIIGCGPIGALVAVASSCTSRRQLLVCDINSARSSQTAALSGATSINLAGFKQFENVSGQTLRYVLDTTGNIDVIQHLIQTMTGCTFGLVGIGSGTLSLDPVHLVERELSVLGCHAFGDELVEAIELLQAMPENFEGIIGERIPLETTVSGYEKIIAGKLSSIKTLIEIAR